jgi:dipeptidyl aminopeptidase/acylaminoacyl peptidase
VYVKESNPLGMVQKMTTLTPKQLIELKRVSDVIPSPCGNYLVVAVGRLNENGTKYISDLWKVSLTDDAPPVQLTFGESNDVYPCFRYDGALGFLSNRALDVIDVAAAKPPAVQVWLLSPLEGVELKPLTSELLGVEQFKFASAGNVLAIISGVDLDALEHQENRAVLYYSKDSSVRRYTGLPVRRYNHWVSTISKHLIVFDSEGNDRRDLTLKATNEHESADFDVSSDGATIVITIESDGEDRNSDSTLLVIDMLSGSSSLLGRFPLTNLKNPQFSPDGCSIACEHHPRPKDHIGKPDLWAIDLDTRHIKTLTKNWDRSPELSGWTNDGQSLIVTAYDQGQIPVFCIGVETDTVQRITPEDRGGIYSNLHFIGKASLIGIWSSFTNPPEPFLINHLSESEPLVVASLSGANKNDINTNLSVESMFVEADDGVAIQAFLIKPESNSAGPLPTIFRIHGGPIYAWCDGWNWNLSPVITTAQGYASVLINPRGSTGFGQEFVEGIRGNVWGEKCYTDIMTVVDRVSALDCVNESKMAVFGFSFGGYMTNWIGVNSNKFKCLISQAGIFSLSSFYSATDFPAYWHRLLAMTDHPFNNLSDCDRYSPHRLIANWTSPALIFHGEKDYRVPISQSLSLFEALLHYGNEAELIVFPDEGHGIGKPKNVEAWYGYTLEFLQRHIG